MKYLLDEQLNPAVAQILSILRQSEGDEFVHIYDIADPGTTDEAIPNLCSENQCRTLITSNHKDFGAKRALYKSLVAAGIHVVVVRPGKHSWTKDQQVSILTGRVRAFSDLVQKAEDLGEQILVRVTPSDVKKRTLEELIAEIGGD